MSKIFALKAIILYDLKSSPSEPSFVPCPPKVNTETVKFKAKGQGIDVAIEKVRSKDIS